MKLNLIFLMASLLLFSGCFKTAEQVNREQKLENIDSQMKESQNLVADITVILKEMQKKIDQISGQVEEMQNNQKNINAEDIAQIKSSMKIIDEQFINLQKDQETLKANQQKLMDHSHHDSSVKSKKKNDEVTLTDAQKAINKKKWDLAQEILDNLLATETSPSEINKILHMYGDMEYRKGLFEKSLIYFSKIFTKYPKSSLAPSSLYHIGLSLKKMKKSDEALQAFEEFEKLYPGHQLSKKVESEIKSI